jgi:hypothetical protein
VGRIIRINGIDVPVIDDELTGSQVKRLGAIPPGRVLVRQELDRNVIIPDSARIRVAGGEVFTHHAHHSKA